MRRFFSWFSQQFFNFFSCGDTKHSFYEIQYALKGKIGMLLGDDRTVNVAESEFIIVPPDTYHQIIDSDSVGARFIMAFSMKPKLKAAEKLVGLLSEPAPIPETPHMRELLSRINVVSSFPVSWNCQTDVSGSRMFLTRQSS